MTRNDSKKRWSPSWGVRIAIVYTTFAVGTLAWAGYAMSRDVDLVRPDYYEYSMEHDQTMRATENAAALGGTAIISVDAEAVVVQLPPSMLSATGTVTLYRPNSMKQDRIYPLQLGADGIMRIPYAALPAGQWEVTAKWAAAGKDYEMKERALF